MDQISIGLKQKIGIVIIAFLLVSVVSYQIGVYATTTWTITPDDFTDPTFNSINSTYWYIGSENITDWVDSHVSTIAAGIGTYSYMIKHNSTSGLIDVINGNTGSVSLSSAYTDVAFQYAFDHMTSGGLLLVRGYNYPAYDTPLQVYDNTTISGENNKMAYLHCTAGAALQLGNSTDLIENVVIMNLNIEGQTAAIDGYYSRSIIYGNTLSGSVYPDGVITVRGIASDHAAENFIYSNKIVAGGGSGIYLTHYSSDNNIYENMIADCMDGIFMFNTSGNMINDNHIYSCDGNGIYAVDILVCTMDGNQIENNDKHGIFIETSGAGVICNDNTMNNNQIWGNSLDGDNLYDGICYIGASVANDIYGTTVMGNKIEGAYQRCGINESGYTDGSLIMGNWIAGNHLALDFVGNETVVGINFGYATPMGTGSFSVRHIGNDYVAVNISTGHIDYKNADLATTIQYAIDNTDMGTVEVSAMNADLNSKITLKSLVALVFDYDGTYNILHSGPAFEGIGNAGSGSPFYVDLNSVFFLYGYAEPTLVNLVNPLNSYVKVNYVGSGSGVTLTNSSGVILMSTGGPCYENHVTINMASKMNKAVWLHYASAIGANANTVDKIGAADCNYGVYIDYGVTDALIQHASAINAIANALVYINGTSNHVVDLYGEWNGGGVLLYLDTGATYNQIDYIKQEGSATWYTDNSGSSTNIIHGYGITSENFFSINSTQWYVGSYNITDWIWAHETGGDGDTIMVNATSGAYRMVIFNNGTHVYAVNTTTGLIAYSASGTDVTTVLQNAINSISNSGKGAGVVYMNPSSAPSDYAIPSRFTVSVDYKITSKVTVWEGISIMGGGTIINMTGCSDICLYVTTTGADHYYNKHDNNMFVGITFIGLGTNNNQVAIYFNQTAQIETVRDCVTIECNTGVAIEGGSYRVIVDHCFLEGCNPNHGRWSMYGVHAFTGADTSEGPQANGLSIIECDISSFNESINIHDALGVDIMGVYCETGRWGSFLNCTASGTVVSDCFVQTGNETGQSGIIAGSSMIITGCYFEIAIGDYAILNVADYNQLTISNCKYYSSGAGSYFLYSFPQRLLGSVTGCIFGGGSTGYGIYAESEMAITGNSFQSLAWCINTTHDGGNNIISDNEFYNLAGGIAVAGHYDIITNNAFHTVTTKIVCDNTGTIIKDNYGYTTESSGTASISSGTSVTVAHNLAVTPNIVTASVSSLSAGNCAVTMINSTHFTVSVETSGSYTVYWQASKMTS